MRMILCGFFSSGKTTLGYYLSSRLALPFFDVDTVIEELFFQENGKRACVREVYQSLGERPFRALETKAMSKICEFSEPNSIIATGGGTLIHTRNHIMAKKAGTILYLFTSLSTLLPRIEQRGLPSFICSNDPSGALAQLFKRRDAIYRKIADIIVETEKTEKEVVIEQVRQLMEVQT